MPPENAHKTRWKNTTSRTQTPTIGKYSQNPDPCISLNTTCESRSRFFPLSSSSPSRSSKGADPGGRRAPWADLAEKHQATTKRLFFATRIRWGGEAGNADGELGRKDGANHTRCCLVLIMLLVVIRVNFVLVIEIANDRKLKDCYCMKVAS
ncbi:uncharacterized protein LOC130715271 [Lotus japonicus]|uniref:uncharacterized protein LOC130715271 n=1 Tax=Lotus japonicus TaxID=34305 RepID=UPI002585F2F3|nr:uncharacterized protein LOC130715271 [Lotus japonicus]